MGCAGGDGAWLRCVAQRIGGMRLVVCGWVGAAEPDAIAEVERQVMMRGPSWHSTEILGVEYALERQGRGLVQLVEEITYVLEATSRHPLV